ncbi:hypothetical protein RCL1_005620 [Eukaryota sp. TZLM3-RCL]
MIVVSDSSIIRVIYAYLDSHYQFDIDHPPPPGGDVVYAERNLVRNIFLCLFQYGSVSVRFRKIAIQAISLYLKNESPRLDYNRFHPQIQFLSKVLFSLSTNSKVHVNCSFPSFP